MEPGRYDFELGTSENEPIVVRLKLEGDPRLPLVSGSDIVLFNVTQPDGSILSLSTADNTLGHDFTKGEISWTPTNDQRISWLGKLVPFDIVVNFAAGPVKRYLVGYIKVSEVG